MIALDVADLVVIAGQVLGIGDDAALAQADITAARDALAQAHSAWHRPTASSSDRAAVAAAGIGLVHALLRYRPFSSQGQQVAVAAGLQFFSLNGWQADLDPPAATAVLVEALVSGRLSPAEAAAWLSPRLSPCGQARARAALATVSRARLAHIRVPLPSARPLRALPVASLPAGRRMLVSALLAIALAGFALVATACSRGPVTPAVYQRGQPAAVRQSARPVQPEFATVPAGRHGG